MNVNGVSPNFTGYLKITKEAKKLGGEALKKASSELSKMTNDCHILIKTQNNKPLERPFQSLQVIVKEEGKLFPSKSKEIVGQVIGDIYHTATLMARLKGNRRLLDMFNENIKITESKIIEAAKKAKAAIF